MKKNAKIFSSAIAARDYYKDMYNKASEKRKQSLKELKSNYLPGSAMFKEVESAIRSEFEEAIQRAKEEITRDFDREYMDLYEHDVSRVKVLTAASKEKFDTLGRLADIPISSDEFGFLVEEYAGSNYWVDRMLVSVGARNGIQSCAVQPDITTRLSTLDELKNNLHEFMDRYNGEPTYSTEILVSDSAVYRLEKMYTNNYCAVNLNAKETGKRIVAEALSKPDSMEQAMFLSNALRTASADARAFILHEIVKNHEGIAQNPNMMLSGVSSAVEEFKKSERKSADKAETALQEAQKAQDEKNDARRDLIIGENLDNEHFTRLVHELGNAELKNALIHQQEESVIAKEGLGTAADWETVNAGAE